MRYKCSNSKDLHSIKQNQRTIPKDIRHSATYQAPNPKEVKFKSPERRKISHLYKTKQKPDFRFKTLMTRRQQETIVKIQEKQRNG